MLAMLEHTTMAHEVQVTFRWDGGDDVVLPIQGVDVAAFDLRPAITRAVRLHARDLSERDVEMLLLESCWRIPGGDDEEPF
jgi:hypothetical protein